MEPDLVAGADVCNFAEQIERAARSCRRPISAVWPVASAPEVAGLIAEMVTRCVPDPAAVSSEHDQQAKLLAAAGAPGPEAELAFRQATALANQTAVAWHPEPFAAQH